MSESHTWHLSNHTKPTYCNVCRESLGTYMYTESHSLEPRFSFSHTSLLLTFKGVTSHGLSCGVCKVRSHKSCLPNLLVACKWSTADTVEEAAIVKGENVSDLIIHDTQNQAAIQVFSL